MLRLSILVIFSTVAVFGQTEKPNSTSLPSPQHHSLGPGDTHKPQGNLGGLWYLDYRDGFLGTKFGSTIDTFQGMSLVDDFGELKIYKKDNQLEQLGHASIKSVVYEFYSGKLMCMGLTVNGPRNADALLILLVTAYGKGYRPKPSDDLIWPGHFATGRYSSLPNGDWYLRVSNNALEQEYNAYEQKAMLEEARKL
jgi:hypothetical protein